MSHDAVYRRIKEAGFAMLKASYSGGNDEGGADSVRAYRLKSSGGFNRVKQVIDRENVEEFDRWDHPMVEVVNDVLSEKYGSWAGEFEAYGEITIDALEGKITLDGQETVWQETVEDWA